MGRLKLLFFVGLLLPILGLGQSNKDNKTYVNDYQTQIETQFKKEDLWYRMWNRYEINPGFSKYSMGPSLSTPNEGWENIGEVYGVRYRREHLEAGWHSWKGTTTENDTLTRYNRYSIGYHTPSRLFRIGRRYMDVKGFLLQPTFGLGYTNTNKEHGLYVSPGLQLQLPFLVIGARANAEYAIGDGFNVFPEVSIQLDALRTLMNPQLRKTGTYYNTTNTVSPLGGGWYLARSSTSANAFKIEDIGPFWGITPRFGYSPDVDVLDKSFNSYGIGLLGRINFFGAEIRYEKTKLRTGPVDNVNALDATVKNEFDKNQVRGLTEVDAITFEGSVNVVGLFLNLFKRNSVSKMSNTTTPLNRLQFHLGYTRLVPGEVEWENEENAIAYTDQFFADRPDIERNAINDPLIQEKEWGVTYGLSLELGAVGVRVNNKLGKSIGKSSAIEMYYALPLTKVFKAYKPYRE